jgi:ElaB/YqjD/DUF883 family membrane-anchored ribosome-binding protein
MSHAEQLEQETEQTRAQIADTLDELRACMTPGRVLDQLADRMSDGAAAAFARNLKDQTVDNPLAVTLIGAGLAWMMLGPRGASTGGLMRRSGERLREAANDAAENVRGAVDRTGKAASAKSAEWRGKTSSMGEEAGEGLTSAAERARQAGADAADAIRDTTGSMTDAARQRATQTADTVRDTAGSIAESARDTAGQAGDAVSGTAASMSESMQHNMATAYDSISEGARRTAGSLSESTKAAGQRTLQSGTAFLDFCRDQPMVVAGLGLAVGAMIGALLPTSETEDRLMGETSDRVKERAQGVASEQYEGAKKVGERAVEAAKDEAVKQANVEGKGAGAKEEKDRAAGEETADGPTLVPSDQSELERRGQPWTADNAPL